MAPDKIGGLFYVGMYSKLGYNTLMENKDDNRIIADMSGVDNRGILSSWFGILDPNVRAEHGPKGSKPSSSPKASQELSPEDRKALIFYAMKYSFGIGMLFLTIFGIVIFLMTKFWH